MSKYNFRLQKLLDIRVDKEEESKRNFTEAQNQKLKVETKLEELNASYEKYRNINSDESAIKRRITHIYLNAINYSINETAEELKQKEKILEDKRYDLKQKQIDRKTVEILKEKGEKAFLKEQNLIEQRNNDEFALYGFIRNHERR
ncbi:flagellar biosynthesis protein FliJ [Clostridium carboxidivorans P7]|uniref:Flagellar FliJ protein n=1 Tax=Clostridium carboxidivorans P7 TaxID=536227 RepID=C6PPE9_9CLOT|nr:flagellar export protein FliJ [Clostridium carboxidivorans]AKN33953.1 flagellar biosynthesis protein FliJ [Clostridium carboxidivorans P7]EET88843.1 flagellar export protein FliJ [Clostridium carboxidivorans P7]EFG88172.1 flagellar export protein FliJ [Clostridium carboxidivorans P7]